MKYFKTALFILFLIITTEIIYLFLLDFVVFNEVFMDMNILKPLFYLLPIATAFFLMLISIFVKKRLSKIFAAITLSLCFTYCALTIFMITGEFCVAYKNFDLFYKALSIFLGLIIGILYGKFIHKSLSNEIKIALAISTIVVTIDLLYFSSLYFIHAFFDEILFGIH